MNLLKESPAAVLTSPGRVCNMLALLTIGLALGQDTKVTPIHADECIVFFPTFGRPDPGAGTWTLDIHGWVFGWEVGPIGLVLLQTALGLASADIDQASGTIFADRARWFLTDNERRKRATVRLADKTFVTEESTPNGHFQGHVQLPREEVERVRAGSSSVPARVFFQAVLPAGRKDDFAGEIHLLDEEGVSVISDIDDTMKISEVRDHKKLLKNTFLLPFREVPGMAEVYQAWARAESASFHYVSASPWQLYMPLKEFMAQKGFPAGTFHLKYFRWKDRTFLSLFESPEHYKVATIEPLLDRFPKRRFLLVGDSGEEDPEAYGVLARKYGGRILGILIRDVTGEAPDAPRYREAFRELPEATWRLFKDPAEVRDPFP